MSRVKIGEVEVEGPEDVAKLATTALALFKATGGIMPEKVSGLGFTQVERSDPPSKDYGEREAGW